MCPGKNAGPNIRPRSSNRPCFSQVNKIKKGVNPSSVHKIYFTGPFVAKGFKIGAVCGMIGLTVCICYAQTTHLVLSYICMFVFPC